MKLLTALLTIFVSTCAVAEPLRDYLTTLRDELPYSINQNLNATFLKESILHTYGNFDKEYPLFGNDFEALNAINDLANQTWTLLLNDCAKSDIEKARKFYFENKFSCGSSDTSSQISQGLKLLHEQLNNFLLTANIEPFYRRGGFYNSENASEAGVSPLLSQALVEQLSTVVRFQDDPWNGGVNIGFHRNWIDYSYADLFIERVNELLSPASASETKFSDAKYNQAKIFKNTFLLSVLIMDHYDCRTWGLWPKAGAYLSRAINMQTYLDSLHGINGTLDLLCPSGKFYSVKTNPLMSKNLIFEYRNMGSHYGFATDKKSRCRWSPQLLMGYCASTDPESPDDLDQMFSKTRRYNRK